MKHSKKVLSILLLLTMLFAGCGKPAEETAVSGKPEGISPDTEAETESETTARCKDHVPEMKFDGETFTFLTKPDNGDGYWGHIEFFAEGLEAVPLNDAVYNRNKLLEERFDIVFDEVCTSAWWTDFNNTIAAQEDTYDCVPLTLDSAGMAAVGGSLLEYSYLDYIDLEQPWWDPVLNDIFTIGKKQYFSVGDLTLVDKEATYIVMFNKDVANDYQIENLYTLVDEGIWTMDRMQEICGKITNDTDGDGKYTFQDTVGMVTDDDAILTATYYANGGTFFRKNAEDMPEYSIDMERSVRILEKVMELYHSNDIMLATTLSAQGILNPWSDQGLNGMFKDGRALFYAISLTVMNKMRDMDSDFGVLPYPKLDETDPENNSFVCEYLADCVAVPITASDPVRTSAILEALCCESSNIVMPAYYDITITNKTTRDEESKRMLDYIFDHRTLDLVQLFNWGGLHGMLRTVRSADTFASSVKKLERVAKRNMEKTFKSMDIADEKQE